MNSRFAHPTAILLVILFAAGLAVWARPTTRLAPTHPAIDLETMIPRQIGTWVMDTHMLPLVVSDSARETLNRIYNQTLTRTYVDPEGNQIMLALAYGSEQNDELKAHRPEICYPAQGFELLKKIGGTISTDRGDIPVTRIVTSKGTRVEPVTYWLAIGSHTAATELQRKLVQLRYGLSGTIPDGMLVRVSSVDPDVTRAFGRHDDFIRSMVETMATDQIASIGLVAAPSPASSLLPKP